MLLADANTLNLTEVLIAVCTTLSSVAASYFAFKAIQTVKTAKKQATRDNEAATERSEEITRKIDANTQLTCRLSEQTKNLSDSIRIEDHINPPDKKA